MYGIGMICQKGCKEDRCNQDTFAIYLTGETQILGVFDGHGPTGERLSHFAQCDLLDATTSHMSSHGLSNISSVLASAFVSCHTHCIEEQSRLGNCDLFDASSSGTTATVAVISKNSITVASVGDSRCILGVESSTGKFKCIELTRDQSAERRDERRRIETSGGEIRRLRGDVPLRVFVKGEPTPGLAMTRAIGDTSGTPAGIIPDPEVATHKRPSGKGRSFIIVASDGVWEFLSSEEVVMIAGQYATPTEAVVAVKEAAVRAWQDRCPFAIDDITCIVSFLSYTKPFRFIL